SPPSLPQNSIYTANYCEENVYFLAKHFLDDKEVSSRWDVFVIFISNTTKSVALWYQKLNDSVVIWDYHVILIALRRRALTSSAGRRLASRSFVYDFDSRLEMPCAWEEYITLTFQDQEGLPEQFRSLLRVVPGDVFVGSFASDRSHMVSLDGNGSRYISVPPPYACIVGEKAKILGVVNNLMDSFVDMSSNGD
ncbi:hypothetical protein SCHPADRAFT_804892, partial [Schizopora paradoxa]